MSPVQKLIVVALVSFLVGIASATAVLGRYEYKQEKRKIIRVNRLTQQVYYWTHRPHNQWYGRWQCPR